LELSCGVLRKKTTQTQTQTQTQTTVFLEETLLR
jgi:hypothetical protein